MRWIAQVGHVARKDVRQVRWMLVLYALSIIIAVVGMQTGATFGPYSTEPNNQILGMPDALVVIAPVILVLTGIVSACTLVQLDSPTSANAFWATRPLTPSAVFASKLLLLLVGIIGVAISGTAVALRAVGLGGTDLIEVLLPAVISVCDWALLVLVLSATTNDLRGFVFGLVATLVGLLLVGWFAGSIELNIAPTFLAAFGILSALAALWFVFSIFRRHEHGRGTWIAGIVIAACLVVASLSVPGSLRDVPTLKSRTMLQIEPAYGNNSTAESPLPLKLRSAVAADSERLDFSPDTLSWISAEGKVTSTNLGTFRTYVVGGALPWVGRQVTWINIDSTKLAWPSTLFSVRQEPPLPTSVSSMNATSVSVEFQTTPVTPMQKPPAKGSYQSVRVTGVVTVSQARVVGSLPLTRDASFIKDGRRVRLYAGESHNGEGSQVWIQLSSIQHPGRVEQREPNLRSHDNLQYALVNDERGEAMMLDAPDRTYSNSGAVVLPQVTMNSSFEVFSTATRFSPRKNVSLDDRWYKNARLVVIEWTVVGQYRAAGETKVE